MSVFIQINGDMVRIIPSDDMKEKYMISTKYKYIKVRTAYRSTGPREIRRAIISACLRYKKEVTGQDVPWSDAVEFRKQFNNLRKENAY